MDPDLAQAFDDHRAGRFGDAARRYHDVLARDPHRAEALHGFGVMHHQCGHHARAAELIGRAVALEPGAATFHANLAEAFRSIGQYEDAVEACLMALRLHPGLPEAANNLGLALQDLGRLAEAEARFREELRARPSFALARNNLGGLLRHLGRADEARDAFHAAFASDPDLAMARANLGQALVEAGDPEGGFSQCKAAVRLRPDLAAAHNNLGNVCRALGRRDEARVAYAEAVRLEPDSARGHANRGLAFQDEGRFPEAAACLRRAIEVSPDDAELWHNLAMANAEDDEYAKALPWFERCVAARPGWPEGHNDLGLALQREGRYAEAEACFARALRLRPDLAVALTNRGGLHEELGALGAAEACYRQAVAADPRSAKPRAQLATLPRGRLPEEDRRAIRDLLGDTRVDDESRGILLFGLAHACDGRGDFAEAADSVARANALTLASRGAKGLAYDPEAHRDSVDRLIESFTSELYRRLAGAGDPTRWPVFVFGMPRSGTTLVEQILASHARVHGAGELRLACEQMDAIPALVGGESVMPAALAALDGRGVEALARGYLDGLRARTRRDRPGDEPDRVVDKMPDNYLYLGLLALLFPGASFVHVRRDPRDVALSCWMTDFIIIRWANDLDHLAGRFREYRRLADHWRGVLPVPVHEVAYERLVDDFDAEARRLVAACGLEWDPACLAFHANRRPVRTASVTQVRRPIYRKAIGRWAGYRPYLGGLFDRVAPA